MQGEGAHLYCGRNDTVCILQCSGIPGQAFAHIPIVTNGSSQLCEPALCSVDNPPWQLSPWLHSGKKVASKLANTC